MSILNIGTTAFDENEKTIQFFSNDNFLDGEILILNSTAIQLEVLEKFCSQKSRTLKNNFSSRLVDQLNQRRNDLDEFLEHGRTIFIELSSHYKSIYNSVEYDESIEVSILDLIPGIDSVELTPKVGSNFEVLANIVNLEYFDNYNSVFQYNFSIKSLDGINLLGIPNTEYIISKIIKVKKGYVILLPSIPRKSLNEINPYEYGNLLFDIKGELNKLKFENNKDGFIEDWSLTHSYEFERANLEKLSTLLYRKEEIEKEIELIQIEVKKDREIKNLIDSYGLTLESICWKVLTFIGFELIESPVDNRTDISAKFGGSYFVFEIKGLVKSSKEKNAAQLQKWVSDFHVENEINPKGILIINGFRSTPLQLRDQPVFPNQMVDYCEKMSLCLISSAQLLAVYLDIVGENKTRLEIIEQIKVTEGIFEYELGESLKKICD